MLYLICTFASPVVFFAWSSHALIIFEGAQVGGGVVMWHTAATTALMFCLFFLFSKHSQTH